MANGFTGVPGFNFPSGRQQGFTTGTGGTTFGTLDPTRGFIPAATALTPELRAQILASGGSTGGDLFTSLLGGESAGGGSALVPSEPSAIESMINDLFASVLGRGRPESGVGRSLRFLTRKGVNPFIRSLSQGNIPPALLEQFERQQAQQRAQIGESFGRGGARFGTDLGRVLGETSEAGLNQLAVSVIERALQAEQLRRQTQLGAFGQLFGLGTSAAGREFVRGENALERALREFLGTQDPLADLLPALIGGGAA